MANLFYIGTELLTKGWVRVVHVVCDKPFHALEVVI